MGVGSLSKSQKMDAANDSIEGFGNMFSSQFSELIFKGIQKNS